MRFTRRKTLAALAGVGAAATAGCASDDTPTNDDDSTDTGSERPPTDEPTSATSDDDRTNTPTDAATGLDLREANVVGVTTETTGDGSYEFAVTLFHDDDGEDGFANWWQVENRDGERLGRRDLTHAHGTRRFTRSETVSTDADCVVVRGHDRAHGYGGRAALVSLADGEVRFLDQGSDRRSMADEPCSGSE